jgi:rRNA maturation endonuclease Nob1
MVRSITENPENGSETLNAADAWARAAANRKYGIHNGVPYVGAEGHVVPLPVPGEWFASVPAVSQGTVFQALAEYVGNRVAQPTAKAENATHEAVTAAAASALTNGFEPARTREKDPVEAEVERQFAALVRARVLEQKPDATDAQIDAYTEKKAAEADGKSKMAELRSAILASGTYAVQRKSRKGAVADLGIDDISF